MRIWDHWKLWSDARASLDMRLDSDTVGALDRAFALARRCHAGQTRETGEPLISHPLEVLEILFEGAGTRDGDLLVAALLHDVVEQTACSRDELVAGFRPAVVTLVDWLTKPPRREGESDEDVTAAYFARFATAPEPVLLLKLADRWSKAQKLDRRPGRAAQVAYYQATVRRVLPLAARLPFFAALFAEWQAHYRYLEAERPV